MKIVSQLDESGYFVGEAIAHESPLQPGVYLIPAGAVDRAPPKTEPGKRYRPWGTGWRGEEVPAPPAPPPEPKPEPPSRAEIIRGQLAQIDAQSLRPARAVAAALAAGRAAPAPDAQRLVELESQAEALRAELAAQPQASTP